MVQDTLPQQPVILMLPLDNLVVPAWNPRKSKDEAEMQVLMDFIKAGGAVDRITVWKGNGLAPWAVISGQRRMEAYKRLGYEQVEVEILDITLEEAKRRARTANRGLKQHWLDDYESWEPYFKDPQFESQEAIAAHVGVDSNWISKAVNLMPVLNQHARELIRQSLEASEEKGVGSLTEPAHPNQGSRLAASTQGDAKNKGNNGIVPTQDDPQKPLKKRILEKPKKWRIAEDVAYRLTAFWDKRSLGDAQALVEKALPVILSRKMNGPQVDGLVKWVSAGNDPQAFNQNPSPLEGTPRVPSGQEGRPVVSDRRESNPVRGASEAVSPIAQVPEFHAQIGALIAGNELAKKLHLPAQALSRLFPSFTRFFQRVIEVLSNVLERIFHGFGGTQGSFPVKASTENNVRNGVKNRVVATFLALFLVLFVGSNLISWSKRLLRRIVYSWTYSGATTHPPIPQNRAVATNGEGGSHPIQTNPNPAHLPPGPQAGGQAMVMPSQGAEGNGGTQMGSVQAPTSPAHFPEKTPEPPKAKPKDSFPTTAPANFSKEAEPKKGEDPLKAVGDAVKGASNAVNTAKEGQSDVDKVKNLLGF